MRKRSAGILMYRFNKNDIQILLAHPGGPFNKNKDEGAWSIPKGEFTEGEDARDAAIREFKEELGKDISGEMITLNPIIQKSGKEVFAWAIKGDLDPDDIVSNTFPMEWPPKSGKIQEFVEIDRVEWFSLDLAKTKIIPGQVGLISQLESLLKR